MDLADLRRRFRGGDRRALARLLTLAARGEALDELRAELAANDAGRERLVVGFSGSGGVGKSSLIGRLVERLRRDDRSVAVLACDPQSPLTGGALLGDRVRIAGAGGDDGVFLRSLAVPGGQQAIAAHLDVMIGLLAAFGFGTILLETVGAGQGDVAVRELVDVVVVLVQPESGDELQWEKAGLLEVADVVVVNKGDLAGADRVVAQLREQLDRRDPPPVLKASAIRADGIDELWAAIEGVAGKTTAVASPGDDATGRIACRADYDRLRRTFRWERPERFNFGFDVVDRWAERAPERTAIHWVRTDVDAAPQERTVTFAEIAARSDRAARALLERGLSPGDRVLIVLPRVIAWWETVVGLLKAGLVAIPGTTLLTSKDIAYRLQASGAAAIVTDAAGAEKVDAIAEALPDLRQRILVADGIGTSRDGWLDYDRLLAESSTTTALPPTRSDDPALVYFTSGTTGLPKMVLHTQASYGLGHRTTGRGWLGLRDDDLHWNISDPGWAKAAWSSLFGPWHCGAGLFVQHGSSKFQPSDVIDLLATQPITSLCAAPTIYRRLVQLDLAAFRPRALRQCVGAGEPLDPETIAVWRRATGLEIRDGYGQTETVLLCGNFPGVPIKPGSMGLPAPGFDLAVVGPDGERLPPGVEGDIAVRVEPERPLGMFREYWRNPEANAASFRDGWYFTGDCGRIDDDGYFWFVGRADDVITSSAYRIGPFEVESALIEHPAVAEAAVVGKPDPLRGEIVKAFVVLAAGFAGSDALRAELQEHVRRTTAPYKYPREIEFVPDLPKTVSGKIRRVELRQRG